MAIYTGINTASRSRMRMANNSSYLQFLNEEGLRGR